MGKRLKPNFLGIGSVRGGSTWLHNVLNSHPAFLLPAKRKELQFFTKYYDRGLDWYYNCFLPQSNKPDAKHVGEITPGYLIAAQAPQRIAEMRHIDKFVLILRDPVDRMFSHYKWHLRVTGEDLSFEEFYTKIPRLAVNNGLYFKNLNRYLKHFDPDQFLILIFEEAVQTPEICFQELGCFFDVAPDQFNLPPATNQSTIPRYRKLFNKAHKAAETLRKKDLDWIPNLIIRLGGKKAFGKAKSEQKISMTPSERLAAQSLFAEDVGKMEAFIGRKIKVWSNFHTG